LKLTALIAIPITIALATAPLLARAEPPAAVYRSETVARPIGTVFSDLKQYFGDPFSSSYKLVTADAANHTLVAEQSTDDISTWTGWAYCVANPMEMFNGFKSGTVRVTVKLTPAKAAKKSTVVSVAGEFIAMYQSGPKADRVGCGSKGRLENAILAAASAK